MIGATASGRGLMSWVYIHTQTLTHTHTRTPPHQRLENGNDDDGGTLIPGYFFGGSLCFLSLSFFFLASFLLLPFFASVE